VSLVAVVGDVTTTTTLALAAAWPTLVSMTSKAGEISDTGETGVDDLLVVELDPTGGSMSAWLDLPAAPTLTTVVTQSVDGGWPAVTALAHRSPSGLPVIPAPPRSVEAARAVSEADRWLVALLAGIQRPTVVVDAGDRSPASGAPSILRAADVTVVVHRQTRHSVRAAAVRVERLAEMFDMVVASGTSVVLTVVGDWPFEPDEIVRFVTGEHATGGVLPPVVTLADDPLSAAALAGRTGVSARRLARLPLMRSAAKLAAVTSVMLDVTRSPVSTTPATRTSR
jgi:MinD-like ATPase involved in chromosome partitioning or flagellar assembly